MDKKLIKRVLIPVVILSIVMLFFRSAGYFLSEKSAIRHSYPYVDGEIIYEQIHGKYKLIVERHKHQYEVAKLIERQFGFLYRVADVVQLSSMSPLIGQEGSLKRTWSASLNSKKLYDTLLVVKSENTDIKKVIISNDNINNELLYDLNKIKANSTLFIELELVEGYAFVYEELKPKDAGGFIFRGLNENDEIILLGR